MNDFKKNFYQPHETTINRPAEEIEQFRNEHSITVPKHAPNPILTFEELQINDKTMQQIKRQNFSNVTPIQAQGWPIALSGKNMVGVAQTG